MYINNTHNNIAFSGKMIVIGKENKKSMQKTAKQVNKMRIVKNSKYNLYISKGSLFDEPLYYISAQAGRKPDENKHFFGAIKTVLCPDAVVSAAKRAIAKAEKEQLQKRKVFSEKPVQKLTLKQKLFNFCDNIMSRFVKFFQDEEDI